jgi:tetratricopeptide (TPR) repeat protein
LIKIAGTLITVKNQAVLVWLCLGLVWISLSASEGIAKDPVDPLVSIVSMDEYGNPCRQGMGILVSKDGSILTSASLMANCRSAIAKSSDNTLYVIRKVTHWDSLQDLALLQIDPGDSQISSVGLASRLQPPEKVMVGVREKAGVGLREAQLTKAFVFSPRLVLLKLEPGNPTAEPGSPVLNRRGELVGMMHAFAGDQKKSQGYRFYLVRDRDHTPFGKDLKREELKWPEEPLRASGPSGVQAFWDGVGSSLREDWQEAQEKFTAALAGPDGLAEAHYGRGVARYHLGDWDGAVKDLEAATRRLSGYTLALLWLGKTREQQGKREAAKYDYEQAVALTPDLSEAWLRLGELAYKSGDLSKAKECLDRTKGDPSQGAQSWWYLGNIALQEHRTEEALEAFRQAIKLEPKFFQAYLAGGKLLLEDLGQPKEAVLLLREAVRLNPGQGMPRYYLALAHLMSWNPAGAWEQYFILRDTSPDLAVSLAMALERSH